LDRPKRKQGNQGHKKNESKDIRRKKSNEIKQPKPLKKYMRKP